MKILALILPILLLSCGDDFGSRREQDEGNKNPPNDIPPIPPIVVNLPIPDPTPPPTTQEPDEDPSGPSNPEPEPVPCPSHDQYLQLARQKYPHIYFREVYGANALTQRMQNGRWMISLGINLKAQLDPESYAMIIAHEVVTHIAVVAKY